MKRWYKAAESCINLKVLIQNEWTHLVCNYLTGCRSMFIRNISSSKFHGEINTEGIFNDLPPFVAYVKGCRRAIYMHEGYETVYHRNERHDANQGAVKNHKLA